MPCFPMFVDLKGKRILVLGGGKVALRKVKKLLPFGANITVTAPRVEPELEALPGVEALTFDLEKLDYISSAGLRVLLSAQKAMNQQGAMKVKNANEMILEIFEVTGFCDILTIE